MKANLVLLSLLFLSIISYGQNRFEKGYFIENDNTKTECFIKNNKWKTTPGKLVYRFSDTGTIRNVDIALIKTFELYNITKYIRTKTLIDRSPTDPLYISSEKNPVWLEEVLFLKVLVEGKASLYCFQDNEIERFFYSNSDTSIKQLVYKRYIHKDKEQGGASYGGTKLATNSYFRNQLWAFVRCPDTDLTSVQNIEYTLHDLEKYFIHYNECMGIPFYSYNRLPKEHLFHLRISPGINYSMFHISNRFDQNQYFDFENQINFSFGIEAEYILPLGNRRIGILFEPTYQYLNQTSQNSIGTATLTFNSIDFPIGLRYYFSLGSNLKLFADAQVIPGTGIMFDSSIEIDYNYALPITIGTDMSYSVGAGVRYRRISSEFRYYFNRQLLSKSDFWISDYTRFALIIGYEIF